jgi:ABC-type branched-subunit amino acid transport system permease subunit
LSVNFFLLSRRDLITFVVFAAVVLAMPLWLNPLGAAYPGLMQQFAIYGLFAVGFNILFGLTGFLSFGHAAFLGAGSYAAIWSFKLLTMDVIPAILFAILVTAVFALLVGFLSLRRSGIYFSILTLAFAQMSYSLAYSVLTPITNGETGLQLTLTDPRVIDAMVTQRGAGLPSPSLLGQVLTDMGGFYFCAVALIIGFFIALKIFASPFGMMLRALKSNQVRMSYTGFDVKPYTLSAFVISGVYAGLAGALLACTDPLTGPDRMQWTASGEIVLMTILGGVGTLLGPVIGAWLVKYFENIFSAFNDSVLNRFFEFLPDGFQEVVVTVTSKFVGDGWNLTLGLLFVIVVVFLPGGLVEGFKRIVNLIMRRRDKPTTPGAAVRAQPAE